MPPPGDMKSIKQVLDIGGIVHGHVTVTELTFYTVSGSVIQCFIVSMKKNARSIRKLPTSE